MCRPNPVYTIIQRKLVWYCDIIDIPEISAKSSCSILFSESKYAERPNLRMMVQQYHFGTCSQPQHMSNSALPAAPDRSVAWLAEHPQQQYCVQSNLSMTEHHQTNKGTSKSSQTLCIVSALAREQVTCPNYHLILNSFNSHTTDHNQVLELHILSVLHPLEIQWEQGARDPSHPDPGLNQ